MEERDLEKFGRGDRQAEERARCLPEPKQLKRVWLAILNLASVDQQHASSVRTGEINSITISTPGMDPVVIDKQAAENIHKRRPREGAGRRTN